MYKVEELLSWMRLMGMLGEKVGWIIKFDVLNDEAYSPHVVDSFIVK